VKIKKKHPKIKARLHPRNKHRERYNFKLLIKSYPVLSKFIKPNDFNDESIDFFNPEAVKALNKALLMHFYNINAWEIPKGYLCPPIPGRADYIHHIADLLGNNNYGKIPKGNNIKCLDIGVGASCVYPIIGNKEYGWSFIGTDIDVLAIENANKIISNNTFLKDIIEFRLQAKSKDIFYGVITKDERFDITICNPPFHSSLEEAQKGTLRKLNNLKAKKITEPTKNFGGQNSELWCDGGENRFVRNLIRESKNFANSCFWFTTLVSKQSNLRAVYNALEKAGPIEVKTIEMGQGNKTSRIVAWTFLSFEQQKEWKNTKWQEKIKS
jgi:23S rRNA (adenine1618-N6)-methyltransferase